MTREDFKVYEDVFDKNTILSLAILKKNYFNELRGCIESGKEANIFIAKSKNPIIEDIIIKIYRIETSNFFNMYDYLKGDPRYGYVSKSRRQVISAWTKKEFSNLRRASKAGLNVPKPLIFKDNILIMEMIGEKGIPSPIAKNKIPENKKEWYKKTIFFMEKLYQKADLVHADLSEFNILNKNEEPYFIDMSQSVLSNHPNSEKFLQRDIKNINKWFLNLGVKVLDENELIKKICRK